MVWMEIVEMFQWLPGISELSISVDEQENEDVLNENGQETLEKN